MKDAYFNGQHLPLSEVTISPMDRGFLFGDAVYEVVALYDGKPFALKPHYDRLCYSLAQVEIKVPLGFEAFSQMIDVMLKETQYTDGLLYVQVTRGVEDKRSHLPNSPIQPTFFAYLFPYVFDSIENKAKGFRAATQADIRWSRCDIKSTALLANVLTLQQANMGKKHYFEVILLRNDAVQEGTASTVCIEKDGVLYTPPLTHHILPSITRAILFDIAKSENIPLKEVSLTQKDLLAADNIWLLSTTKEISPVTELDGLQVGTGAPSNLWHQCALAFQTLTRQKSS